MKTCWVPPDVERYVGPQRSEDKSRSPPVFHMLLAPGSPAMGQGVWVGGGLA